jgi:pimeloyl-ACP methyl ester carboxylesterase
MRAASYRIPAAERRAGADQPTRPAWPRQGRNSRVPSERTSGGPSGPAPSTPMTRRTLVTPDGERISAVHRAPGPRAEPGLAFVIAHGFTGSWRRASIQRTIQQLAEHGGVVAFDFRGHGDSTGHSTLGDVEIQDLDTALAWARDLGYPRVASIGFSMGGSVVVRHAALLGGVAAVVSVSGPGWWYFRGTPAMRRVHWIIERRLGRVVGRFALGTRIAAGSWQPIPDSPSELAGRISPVPLLVVHGDRDRYFPLAHGRALYAAANEPRELWIERGFGHAEAAATSGLISRIGAWARGNALPPGTT